MSRPLHIKLSLSIVCALALVATACGGSSSSTTAPTTVAPTSGTENVTGQMAPGGAVVHQFTASATGTVSVTLTATDPASTLVGLGIGIPGNNAAICDMTKTIQARPGTTAQLTASVESGTYCAGTFDVGGLSSGGVLVTYSVAHP